MKKKEVKKHSEEKEVQEVQSQSQSSGIVWRSLKVIFLLVVIINLSMFTWFTYKELTKQPEVVDQTRVQQFDTLNTVNNTGSDVAQLFRYINASGGIPIKIQTETNWTQFLSTIFLSSFFMLFFFGGILKTGLENTFMKISLRFIKAKTNRHILFIKHTEQGLFSGSMISQTTMSRIQKALIKFKGEPFDLILHTPGGEVFAALFISRLFKEYPGHINAVVPMYAMSGGTLLALSADTIEMSPTACMGPVDPQLGGLFSYGSAAAWEKIVKFKGKKADDQSISFALMGTQYTKTIRNHLNNVMTLQMDNKKKEEFIKLITSGHIEHAFALTALDLQKMGVPVKITKDKDLIIRMIKFIIKSGNEGVTYV